MRVRLGFVLVAGTLPCALMFCSQADKPAPLFDSDASTLPLFEAGQYEVLAEPHEASTQSSFDGGVASARDYQGLCDQGKLPVWHFFDFQTHTPSGTAITFRAQSALTQPALDNAPSVSLGTVTGPDITVWTGVDIDPKLTSIGQKSLNWLRVTTVLYSSDGGTPAVNATRQMYDCILAQ
jgi:hypothetical protein